MCVYWFVRLCVMRFASVREATAQAVLTRYDSSIKELSFLVRMCSEIVAQLVHKTSDVCPLTIVLPSEEKRQRIEPRNH